MRVQGIIGSTQIKLHKAGLLDEIVRVYGDEQGTSAYWKDICGDIMDSKQAYVEKLQVSDFGMAPSVNEGTPGGYDDFRTPYSKQFQGVKRFIGFKVSTEALESDQKKVIMAMPMLALALHKTKEQAVANVLVQATNTDARYAGPDSKPLGSSSHPYEGGTQSNTTTNLLSYSNIETGIQALMGIKSHRGDPWPSDGPLTLVVPTNSAGYANRIVNTNGIAGSANKDNNWAGGQISKVSVNPYLTDTDAWYLIDQKSNKIFLLQRRKATTQETYDQDYDAMKYSCTEIYLPHFADWRGVYVSTGS